MMRLIDADNVLKSIEELKQSPFVNSHDSYVRHMMRETLDVVACLCVKKEPTVTAGKLIKNANKVVKNAGYLHYGVKMESEENEDNGKDGNPDTH